MAAIAAVTFADKEDGSPQNRYDWERYSKMEDCDHLDTIYDKRGAELEYYCKYYTDGTGVMYDGQCFSFGGHVKRSYDSRYCAIVGECGDSSNMCAINGRCYNYAYNREYTCKEVEMMTKGEEANEQLCEVIKQEYKEHEN